MMVFLYIVVAVLGISSIITFLIVFLINRASSIDDYDEVENAKTKTFDPDKFEEDETFSNDALIISENLNLISDDTDEDIFIEEVKSEEELDKVDFLENTQTRLKINKKNIKNKFDSDISNKEELKELEKTSNNLRINIVSRDREEIYENPVIEPVYNDESSEEII